VLSVLTTTALLEAQAKPLSLFIDCQRAPSNDSKSPGSIDEILFVGSSSQLRDISDRHASLSLNPQPRSQSLGVGLAVLGRHETLEGSH
jgi:hypothetical protein